MLSIVHDGEAFVLEIRLCANRFIPPTSLVVVLNNPSDPAAEFVAQTDWNEGLTLNELYSTKKKTEEFAMEALCRHITSYQQILHEDLKVQHEPVANSFPDFELCIGEEKWDVEVTRIESGMISYIDMSKTIERRTIDHFSTNRVTVDAVTSALQKALRAKARRRARCSRYCLLLVDVVDALGGNEWSFWDGADLTAFDAVGVVRRDGSVCFMKGRVD